MRNSPSLNQMKDNSPPDIHAALMPNYRSILCEFLVQHFNLDELKQLAFELAVDYEILQHDRKGELARELISYFERRDQLSRLILEILKKRHDDGLARLFAALPAGSPRTRIQIIVAQDLVENASGLIEEFAAMLGLTTEEVALVGATWGSSIHLLIGIPEVEANLRQLPEILTLAHGKYEVVSVRVFDSLDRTTQQAWRFAAQNYPPVCEDNILRPLISWGQVLKEAQESPLGPNCLGLVSTAMSSESTQDEFYFWVDSRRLVEATQLVRVTMRLPAEDPRVQRLQQDHITVIGIVEQVRRQSESRNVGTDHARYNGRVEEQPLLPPTGFSYAQCRVLSIDPPLFVPLSEGLPVYLASQEEAGLGYGYPDMEKAKADLVMGLLCNGGAEIAGAAKLDTRYILGESGGHVNVTGVAGTGTKTSFLMVLVKMLLCHARATTLEHPASPLYVVPIVFNVKGNDLMWLSRPNKHFEATSENWDLYRRAWSTELFGEFAQPFEEAAFYSYPTSGGSIRQGLPPATQKYTWGLQDVIEWGVEKYLFSTETRAHELMQGILEDAFQYISQEHAGAASRRTLDCSKGISNFDELIEWLIAATVKDAEQEPHYLITRQHDKSTIKATARRLNNILAGARGVLVRNSASGEPPEVAADRTTDPIVIDIDGLEEAPQRFVVASVIERLKQHRERHADRRQRYIIVLDELNRFAPRGSTDEVSKLFEHVAAQLRSQGIILFGAQQKASSVAPLVWENASTKVLGRTGAVELSADMWRQVLPAAVRSRAANLGPDEKIIIQDIFGYPMLANIPFTPWATRKDEIKTGSTDPGKSILDRIDFGD